MVRDSNCFNIRKQCIQNLIHLIIIIVIVIIVFLRPLGRHHGSCRATHTANQPLGRVEQVDGCGAIGDDRRLHAEGGQHLNLELGSGHGDGLQRARADGLHHVLELGRLDLGRVARLLQLQIVLFLDKLELRVPRTRQTLQLRLRFNLVGLGLREEKRNRCRS